MTLRDLLTFVNSWGAIVIAVGLGVLVWAEKKSGSLTDLLAGAGLGAAAAAAGKGILTTPSKGSGDSDGEGETPEGESGIGDDLPIGDFG
jgi:hypothetical protein